MLRNETSPMYRESLYNTSTSNAGEENLKTRQIQGFGYPDDKLSPLFDIPFQTRH